MAGGMILTAAAVVAAVASVPTALAGYPAGFWLAVGALAAQATGTVIFLRGRGRPPSDQAKSG